MSNIISIVNQKGGVAKTTTAINLSSSLVSLGKKVLVLDIDPQSNLTQGLGFTQQADTSIYEVLTEKLALDRAIYNTDITNLDIIPSSISLANAEIELAGELGRETLLREAIEDANLSGYDYVIIDCNPSLGLLTINALSASQGLIIPVEPGVFALEGIGQLIKVIKLIKRKINPQLEIEGVLLTRVDGRTNIAADFQGELEGIFDDKVFDTLIHQNVAIAQAQIEEKPVNLYDKKARGAQEYMELAKELINSGLER